MGAIFGYVSYRVRGFRLFFATKTMNFGHIGFLMPLIIIFQYLKMVGQKSRSLSDREIDQYYQGNPYWGGVHSKDAMTGSPDGKFYVVNLQSLNQGNRKGTHWVLIFDVDVPDVKDLCLYFDPYGIGPPPILESFCSRSRNPAAFCDDTYQAMESTNCGYYCIMAADALLKGMPYKKLFTEVLDENKVPQNEARASAITLDPKKNKKVTFSEKK